MSIVGERYRSIRVRSLLVLLRPLSVRQLAVERSSRMCPHHPAKLLPLRHPGTYMNTIIKTADDDCSDPCPAEPLTVLISVFNSDDSQAAQSHEELAFFVNRLPCYVN